MARNAVDLDEYPASQVIHNRCVSMSAYSHLVKTLNACSLKRCSRKSLEGTQRLQRNRYRHRRVLRSDHAWRARHEETLARSPESRRQGLLPSEYCLWCKCASRSREVRALLGCRGTPRTRARGDGLHHAPTGRDPVHRREHNWRDGYHGFDVHRALRERAAYE